MSIDLSAGSQEEPADGAGLPRGDAGERGDEGAAAAAARALLPRGLRANVRAEAGREAEGEEANKSNILDIYLMYTVCIILDVLLNLDFFHVIIVY